MAKRKTETQPEEARRESRKEILRKRKQEEQLRFVRIGIAVVVAVVVLVIVVALVNEFVLVPSRAVATVNEQEISLRDWQERVRFERAQRIVALENQLELFQGDVGPIQQFAGQTILELQDAESLGQSVLDRMVEEEIVRQAAEDRGLEVTEEEVQARVGELFNFYGGAAPTPQPTATATIQPTPSLTPIPAAGEEGAEAEPTQEPLPTPTQGPTSTPLPTPTPVSEEAFQQEFNDFISEFTALGASEETYRGLVAQQILREQLTDALAEEANLPEEDEQVSMYVLTFPNEEAAVEARQEIQDTDFLTVWNTIRSTPPDPEQDPAEVATATEVLWRTEETLRSSFSDAIAEEALQLPLNVASQPIPAPISGAVEEEEPRYVIIMVSGREVRDLSQQELETRRQALVSNLIDQVLAAGLVDISEFWRGRTPVVPVLDAKFLAPPTATPPVAGTGGDEGLDIPLPEVPPEDTGGEDSGE